MTELIQLKEFSKEDKIKLLNELNFESDGEYVLNEDGSKVVDKYLDIFVKIDNMMILPGSTIILDDNEYSLMRYMQEYENLQ